jgi:acetyl esterase/lipase
MLSLSRRHFVLAGAAGIVHAAESITRPVISEKACPLTPISPGQGFLRKPPGNGPVPALLYIHGGLQTRPAKMLRELALNGANPCRFLAAGYAVAVITYRSRDHDPQSPVSLEDCLAAVDFLRNHPEIDRKSIAAYGCSGGGDLALELAAATDLAAIVPEEPATVLFTGVFNAKFPKKGERHTPADAAPLSADPKRYYTAEYQKLTREKISRIRCPILIVQGDQHSINRYNAEVFLPELRAAKKKFDLITYPGQNHCFGFDVRNASESAVQANLKMFRDADAFLRRHLPAKPKELDRSLVSEVPVNVAASNR